MSKNPKLVSNYPILFVICIIDGFKMSKFNTVLEKYPVWLGECSVWILRVYVFMRDIFRRERCLFAGLSYFPEPATITGWQARTNCVDLLRSAASFLSPLGCRCSFSAAERYAAIFCLKFHIYFLIIYARSLAIITSQCSFETEICATQLYNFFSTIANYRVKKWIFECITDEAPVKRTTRIRKHECIKIQFTTVAQCRM